MRRRSPTRSARLGLVAEPSFPAIEAHHDPVVVRTRRQVVDALAGLVAFMYRDGRGTKRNDAQALAWYRKAAEQGHAPSEYNLGLMYAQGEGAKRDPAAAEKWFRRAADHGSVEAQVKLAEIAIADQKYEEAFLWFSKAAEQGDADAAFNVGSLYYVGRGVAKDEAKAAEHYRKAAQLGMTEARSALKSMGQEPE